MACLLRYLQHPALALKHSFLPTPQHGRFFNVPKFNKQFLFRHFSASADANDHDERKEPGSDYSPPKKCEDEQDEEKARPLSAGCGGFGEVEQDKADSKGTACQDM
ncbi:uncharacterized protein LOC128856072 [Anastrepha ludens]|uniref:uncharacterized protein LOC128856072 n=1 Tax=Anastrepha ludens TaxID=28586 RepID=UPI0023B0EFF8|nr:uncharacterized protein LOC128856072 [Anastrepha ludens]